MYYLLMSENTDGLANSTVSFYNERANAVKVMMTNVKSRLEIASANATAIPRNDGYTIENDGGEGLDSICWTIGEVTASDTEVMPLSDVLASDGFINEFNRRYTELYDSYDKVDGYDAMMKKGDAFIKANPAAIVAFAKAREDFLSSDREVAAFGFTLKTFNL